MRGTDDKRVEGSRGEQAKRIESTGQTRLREIRDIEVPGSGEGPVKEFDRTERIGAELQRDLAEVLRTEVKDPRLQRVTIQEVRVSRDLSCAKVFFTCFPTDECGPEQSRLLNGRLAGFLRARLARRVRLRSVPRLQFVHDESIARGERLSQLIEDAVETESGTDGV